MPRPLGDSAHKPISSRWRAWCLTGIPLSFLLYKMLSTYRAAVRNDQEAVTTSSALRHNLTALPVRNASVAVIFAGDARTLICPEAAEGFNDAILRPLTDANYSVHVFAFVKPSVYYGSGPWMAKNPLCAKQDTPLVNLSKSFVPASVVEDAVARLNATSREVRVMDEATVKASWGSTVKERAKLVGCGDALKNDVNATLGLIHDGFIHYAQWKAVRDGYEMMERAEDRAGERFEHVMRLRPDTRPLMGSILDDRRELPPSASDPATITHYGDGQAVMRRESSDAYFNSYQTYGRYCDTYERLRGTSITSDSYFSDFIKERGIKLAGHNNFTFWFRRPRSCTQLCEEKLPGYDM